MPTPTTSPANHGATRPHLASCFEEPAAPSPWQRLLRCWCIVRYHRAGQLAMRVVNRVRLAGLRRGGGRRYEESSTSVPALRGKCDFGALFAWKAAARDQRRSSRNAQAILDGRFRFLNTELTLPSPVDWRLVGRPEASLLWRFHLHYQEYLLDLANQGARTGQPAWFQRARRLVEEWIQRNPPGDARVYQDAWRPYCISRRLPSWIGLWTMWPSAVDWDESSRRRVLRSLVSQTRFLEEHLEWDLRGNHLFENAAALIVAGAFFEGPEADRWMRRGVEILDGELAEQVLPHGEHFERSPMYHAMMLETLLNVRDLGEQLGVESAGAWRDTAKNMATFLQNIVGPDGGVPLLGDTSLEDTPRVVTLFERTAQRRRGQGGESVPAEVPSDDRPTAAQVLGDYWIFRDGKDFLLFDAGPVGPDHLPAHAHADLLTFEASVAGKRLFVDSGVFNYDDDAMRRYCRSTAAHNVVQLDGQDQCDIWSRFRMGRRGWPTPLQSGREGGFHWARSTHNAYRRLGTDVVGRWMACRESGPWFCVDWTRGRVVHEVISRLHFHPNVNLSQTADDQVRLELDGVRLLLRYLTPGRLDFVAGWYCPSFGEKQETTVLQWTPRASASTVMAWSLRRESLDGAAVLRTDARGDLLLEWTTPSESVVLRPRAKSQ